MPGLQNELHFSPDEELRSPASGIGIRLSTLRKMNAPGKSKIN